MAEWRFFDWLECPDCGCIVAVKTAGDGNYVYDGDEVNCPNCGLQSWINVLDNADGEYRAYVADPWTPEEDK